MIIRCALALIVAAAVVGPVAQRCLATEQEPDLLILEGAPYYTHALPSLAESLPGVDIPKFRMLTTANYRGYHATWAVIASQLFIVGVEGKTDDTEGKRMLSTPELFPKISFPFKVTSLSGTIVLKGRHLDYTIDDNSIITYTDTLTLTFELGKVVDVSKTTHTEDLKKPVHERGSANKAIDSDKK